MGPTQKSLNLNSRDCFNLDYIDKEIHSATVWLRYAGSVQDCVVRVASAVMNNLTFLHIK